MAVSPHSLISGVIWQISSYTFFTLQAAVVWHNTLLYKRHKKHWKKRNESNILCTKLISQDSVLIYAIVQNSGDN